MRVGGALKGTALPQPPRQLPQPPLQQLPQRQLPPLPQQLLPAQVN